MTREMGQYLDPKAVGRVDKFSGAQLEDHTVDEFGNGTG